MLVLSREVEEAIVLGHGQQLWVSGPNGLVPVGPIEISINAVRCCGKVRLGITADEVLKVHRKEICDRIAHEAAIENA
jgi:sRNA-binding carbon storage regulator CsrA